MVCFYLKKDGCFIELENDIRNRKYKIEDGLFCKHSKNFSELKRIYYICEKKEMRKRDQQEREIGRISSLNLNKNNGSDIVIDLSFGQKNKKNKGKKKNIKI